MRRAYIVLFKLYAREISKLYQETLYQECPGCQINHPSQSNHPLCLQEDLNLKLDCILTKISDKIDEDKITKLLKQKLRYSKKHENCKIFNIDWRKRQWHKSNFRDTLIAWYKNYISYKMQD